MSAQSSKPFAPNQERQDALAKLRDYALTLKDGQRVSWVEVEQATGVKMNRDGQALMRLTLRRQKRPYMAIPGSGFEMSSPDNGIDIVQAKTQRFLGALHIAKETTEQVSGRHIDEMPADKKQKLQHHQAVFATLSLSASLAKKLPSAKT